MFDPFLQPIQDNLPPSYPAYFQQRVNNSWVYIEWSTGFNVFLPAENINAISAGLPPIQTTIPFGSLAGVRFDPRPIDLNIPLDDFFVFVSEAPSARPSARRQDAGSTRSRTLRTWAVAFIWRSSRARRTCWSAI